jgi:hypothetical protein
MEITKQDAWDILQATSAEMKRHNRKTIQVNPIHVRDFKIRLEEKGVKFVERKERKMPSKETMIFCIEAAAEFIEDVLGHEYNMIFVKEK